jgi:hypothetical protein
MIISADDARSRNRVMNPSRPAASWSTGMIIEIFKIGRNDGVGLATECSRLKVIVSS